MSIHEHYMSQALRLAERGLFTTDPNPRVGCILVKKGQLIAEGWHQCAGERHAEINALLVAKDNAKDSNCYVTLEPCSHTGRTAPCAEALIKSGIKRVFIAMKDPNPLVSGKGIAKLKQAGIGVTVGLLEKQAEALNPGFCQRMRIGRPYVRTKIAMSLDGRTAMDSGESQWITRPEARIDVQRLRARSSAIITGIGTIKEDDSSLTVRLEDEYPKKQTIRQPLRVVVDSQLQIADQAKVLKHDGDVLIASAVAPNRPIKAEIIALPNSDNNVDLVALMAELAQREINEVMVEAGSVLNGALLSAQLIDEMVVYMAPKLMGDSAKGLFHLPALQTMAQNIDLTITDIRAIGKDWRITAIPNYNEKI